MMYWGFRFSSIPGDQVGEGEIRLDAPPPYVGKVTRLYVDNLDRDGAYVRNILLAYPAGTSVYLEEPTTGHFASFHVTHAPVARYELVELPVVCVGASPGGLADGPIDAAFLRIGSVERVEAVEPVASVPFDAATDPDLITLDVAKMHLHITDTDHDADVQDKVTAASATIRDYLKAKNDPLWTPATVPPWIAAAVKLLTAHLYEHRGDAFGPSQDNDDRVWEAIANLCRRSRDPALA
jgi:Phage gp6-like head-tail connector protein